MYRQTVPKCPDGQKGTSGQCQRRKKPWYPTGKKRTKRATDGRDREFLAASTHAVPTIATCKPSVHTHDKESLKTRICPTGIPPGPISTDQNLRTGHKPQVAPLPPARPTPALCRQRPARITVPHSFQRVRSPEGAAEGDGALRFPTPPPRESTPPVPGIPSDVNPPRDVATAAR